MSWYAQIGVGNVVQQVLFVVEGRDETWCAQQYGGTWIETFENGGIRKNYAAIGYIYDKAIDAFIHPKPYPSWVLNLNTAQWEAPVPYPNDGGTYVWDEATLSWVVYPKE